MAYLGYHFSFEGALDTAFMALLAITAAGTFVKQVVNIVQIDHAAKLYRAFLKSNKAL